MSLLPGAYIIMQAPGFYFAVPNDSSADGYAKPHNLHIIGEREINELDAPFVDIEQLWSAPRQAPFNCLFSHMWRESRSFSYLDVGAHVGMEAFGCLTFAKRCGRPLKAYCFEPGETFDFLSIGAKLNGFTDSCMLLRSAVADYSGVANFNILSGNASAGSSLLANAGMGLDVGRATVTREIITIDDFVQKQNVEGDIIAKVDTEGTDFSVLRGMAKTMASRNVITQIEIAPTLLDRSVSPATEIAALMASNILFENQETTPLSMLTMSDVHGFIDRVQLSQYGFADLILIPKLLPGIERLIERLQR
jgi:FkbM family methyltransferase